MIRLGDEIEERKTGQKCVKPLRFFMEIIGKMVGTPLGMGKPE